MNEYQRILKECDWPEDDNKVFEVQDDFDEHAPCYLFMLCGEGLEFNHHAVNGVDQARAQFVADACNAYLHRLRSNNNSATPMSHNSTEPPRG